MKALLLFLLLISKAVFAEQLGLLDTFWQSPDQIAKAQYDKGNYQQSADLFEDKIWRANALYKAGEFAGAADIFNDLEYHYNYGNALAQQQKYAEAIEAYQKVDKNSADYADVLHNLSITEKLLKQQKQQQGDKQSDKQSDKEEDKQGEEEGEEEGDKEGDKEGKEGEEGDKEGDKERDKEDKEGDKQGSKKEDKEGDKESDKERYAQQKKQIDKQRLEQIFKKVRTEPIKFLQKKFLIDRELRQKNKSKLINNQGQISW